jgi:hypothetical protein
MQAKEKIKLSLEDIVPEDREMLSCMRCLVCTYILENAYSDSCGHIYCRDCFLSKFTAEKKCPISNLEIAEPTPVPYVDIVINKVNIYCPNKKKVCTWEGVKSMMEQHILTECPKELMTCPYDRCGVHVLREVMSFHNEHCVYRKISCEYCKESVAFIDLSLHYEVCEAFPIDCPNLCGQRVMKKQSNDHVDNECPKTIIPCPFTDRGCKDTIERSSLDSHLNNNMGKHMIYLNDKRATPNASPTLFNLLNELKEEFTKNKKELKEEIKNELQEHRKETKENLSNANSHLEKLIGTKRPREDTEDEELSDLETKALGKLVHFYSTAKDETNFSINAKTVKHTADKNYTFIFHKYKKTSKYNEWSITLNTVSSWMAFGLCSKEKMLYSKEVKDKFANVKNGYFITIKGDVYNNSNPEENSSASTNFELKAGDKITFRYEKAKSCLYFSTSTGTHGRLTKIESTAIAPCIVFYHKSDEITLDY